MVLLRADVRRLPRAGADAAGAVVLFCCRAGPRPANATPSISSGSRTSSAIARTRRATVEFHGAEAWLIGVEGRGIAIIIEMANYTRLDCALGTAGLMRQAVSQAAHHTAHRTDLSAQADRSAR